jgi:HEPN domain-containing protein
LAEDCSRIDKDFSSHIDSGRILDQYYIPTRYPDALAPPAVPFESYTEEQGEKAVHAAQAIVSLVRQKLRIRKKG